MKRFDTDTVLSPLLLDYTGSGCKAITWASRSYCSNMQGLNIQFNHDIFGLISSGCEIPIKHNIRVYAADFIYLFIYLYQLKCEETLLERGHVFFLYMAVDFVMYFFYLFLFRLSEEQLGKFIPWYLCTLPLSPG